MRARKSIEDSHELYSNTRPAFSDEDTEKECISLSYKLAEKRLREGTATSQEICYFLKIGSQNEKKEREKLEEEIKLLRAKTETLEAAKNSEEVYTKAIEAMKRYSGIKETIDENLL